MGEKKSSNSTYNPPGHSSGLIGTFLFLLLLKPSIGSVGGYEAGGVHIRRRTECFSIATKGRLVDLWYYGP